jgi:UDP-N-acetylmuramoyl-L-alanyl-D-glutamate--2,6-diaminopimelate ligase
MRAEDANVERLGCMLITDDDAFLTVSNARRTLALTAARLYPRQPGTIAAVTGTSGKTSVAAFTRQLWTKLGYRAASIGTIGVVTPAEETYSSLTTPHPIELHTTLDRLAQEGITHVALEATSHGLDQHRLDGVNIAVGGFTNISNDHLDYHGTMEAYVRAKLVLFERLVPADGAAVVQADRECAERFADTAKQRGLRLLTVGRRGEFIRLTSCAADGFSQIAHIVHGGKEYCVRIPLVGAFQIENVLVAAAQVIGTGDEAAAVFRELETLVGVKGRLELVGYRNGAPIFIDYAHKPDALAKALDALRPYTRSRLSLVFGAGGACDQSKRPLMGAIAAAKADRVIVTDDNPRTEDPATIRAALLAAADGAQEIGDRREAIGHAIEELKLGDVLLIAGKGHETGQTIGRETVPFSDHEAVATALRENEI